MSTMTVETRVTHKYLMNKTKWDLAFMYLDLLDRLEDVEANNSRFMNHLNNLAYEAGVDWTDGEFPYVEVLEKLKK
jgi:hypothetical protein